MKRRVVGVMTGTSIDGIDAAMVEIDGARLEMRATLVSHHSRPLGPLAIALRDAAAQRPMTTGALSRLATDFGTLHADLISELLAPERLPPDFIAAHGQTVFHHPPHSWQLIDSAPIATRFGVPVVTDFRAADLAAGGRGAPITPLADWILYRAPNEQRAIVNLGGFCNVTTLPPADTPDAIAAIRGRDVCACNQVLDAVARFAIGTPYDTDGEVAESGTANGDAAEALETLLSDQRIAARALGTGDEAESWVRRNVEHLTPPDLAATAVEAIASQIAACLNEIGCDRAIVAGGGCCNRALLAAIKRAVAAPSQLSDAFGVPFAAREAAAIAVLGALCADGVAITLPQVTGCTAPAPLAGIWAGSVLPIR